MKGLWPYCKAYTKELYIVVIGSLLTAGLSVCFPMVARYILSDVLPAGDIRLLLAISAVMAVLYVLSLGISYIVAYVGKTMGAHIEHDLRCRLFLHMEEMSFSFFDRHRTGQLLSRLISDIGEIGNLTFQVPNLAVVCLITMAGSFALMLYINIFLGILVAALLCLKAYETVYMNEMMKKSFLQARERTGGLSSRVGESLTAIRLVQSFCNEALELEKFKKASIDLFGVQKESFKTVARLGSGILFFTNITNLTVILAGALLIQYNKMELSDLVAFLMYISIFMRPIMQLTVLTEVYQRGMAGFARYQEMMQYRPEIADDPQAVSLSAWKGEIVFDNVSFGYDGKDLLFENFNLAIKPGELVAVVGPTGVGKTSLCSLIPRFYECRGGSIRIDGMDIRKIKKSDLRRHIGIVQQDIYLFSDSLWENIAYGKPGAAKEEIIEAAKLANAHEFIMNLPDGYDSFIGERGVMLSGGQKQRIAIARIFLKNPPILILDEATSALDNETEKKIQHALAALAENRTTLIIAHRLATIQQADRIIVLEKDGIAEEGRHEELLMKKGKYYDLYMAQFQGQQVRE